MASQQVNAKLTVVVTLEVGDDTSKRKQVIEGGLDDVQAEFMAAAQQMVDGVLAGARASRAVGVARVNAAGYQRGLLEEHDDGEE